MARIQLEVVANITSSMWLEPNRKPGDVVWAPHEAAARQLIEGGLCRYLGGGRAGPAETKPAGPSEAKPVGPSEVKKNRFGGPTAGPSTVSASLSPSGLARLSSASAGVLVLPHRI